MCENPDKNIFVVQVPRRHGKTTLAMRLVRDHAPKSVLVTGLGQITPHTVFVVVDECSCHRDIQSEVLEAYRLGLIKKAVFIHGEYDQSKFDLFLNTADVLFIDIPPHQPPE